jgi:putative SOS response-associated peptidase YedK
MNKLVFCPKHYLRNSFFLTCLRVFQQTLFNNLVYSQRCLIPAGSYYEWHRQARTSIPYCILLPQRSIFAFAGIWTQRKQADKTLHSFAIITAPAKPVIAAIHPRMPVIIPEKHEKKWLSDSLNKTGIENLLHHHLSEKIKILRIEQTVNNVHNNSIDNWKVFEEENIGGLFE